MQISREFSRFWLGFVVLVVSVIGIIAVSITAIGFASDSDEASRLVFASILPLLGTWVGTVLAFYFAKENLASANETTLQALQMAGTFSDVSSIAEVMVPLDSIRPIERVADLAAARQLSLRQLHRAMERHEQSRVPIVLESSGAPIFVVHEPELDGFAQRRSTRTEDLPADLTMADLLQITDLREAVENFIAVSQKATVAETREAMKTASGCKDVFVTDTGTVSGKIVGWVTNSALARSS